jgi:hypothetical protein
LCDDDDEDDRWTAAFELEREALELFCLLIELDDEEEG